MKSSICNAELRRRIQSSFLRGNYDHRQDIGRKLPTQGLRCFRFGSINTSHSFATQTTTTTPNEVPWQYGVLNETDLEVFSRILKNKPGSLFAEHVNRDSDDVLEYASVDWTGHWKSRTPLVLRPQSTEEVSALLAHCHERRLPVVPQGGKTGLVGGSIPKSHQFGEIVLQLQNMKQIGKVDSILGTVKCQAGVILQNLQETCSEHDLLVPLDLGAKGTCQIGGNLATNAGGQYYRRYGSLAGSVLGLEVVLADGRILDLNFQQRTNLKDNTGYKLHQLMIGSEGTLGIITGVALACSRQPISKQAAFVAVDSYDKVLSVILKAQQHLGETLAAIEFMDATILRMIAQSSQQTIPVDLDSMVKDGPKNVQDCGPFFLLIDTHGSNIEHDQEKMDLFLTAIESEILDGAIAQDLQQYSAFWKIRESANPTVAQHGYTYKYDISLPIADFVDWIQEMRKRLDEMTESDASIVNPNWGHVLDGNLHFNVTTIGDFECNPELLNILEPYLFQSVLARGGSISAEHGLGQSKNDLLPQVHSDETLGVMHSMKELLDPNMILNPGKFLPNR